jgi:hypothetical protein
LNEDADPDGLSTCAPARRRVLALGLGLAAALAAGGPGRAQTAARGSRAVPRRLATPPKPVPENGTYFANGEIVFVVDHLANQVRLRFADNDEVFYLSSEPASLGGRLLKYDTGDTALRVAGWGGVTLYTESARNGVPAERSGDAEALDPPPVAANDIKRFAAALSQDLSDRASLAVGFAADWNGLAKNDRARQLTSEAMRNAALALKSVVRQRGGRSRAARITIVRAVAGEAPGVKISNGVLTITYCEDDTPQAQKIVGPAQALAGRPSSLLITKTLLAAH